MANFKKKWCLWAAMIAVLQAGSVYGEARSRSSKLAEGTRWEMPVWEVVGESPGPTIVIVGGVHGNEPAGMKAASNIATWSLARGRLIVIPSANRYALEAGTRRRPNAPPDLADLNRNFPTVERGDLPRGDLARLLWEYLQLIKPDWVIDLHEGFDFHQINDESVGSSIIYHATNETDRVVPKMLQAVNISIDEAEKKFVPLGPPVNGSLARAAAIHLGAKSMILETTYKQPMALRVEQHCAMVECLLSDLDMLGEAVEVASSKEPVAR